MKAMKNFAAQQLSKKEMNNVKGGRVYCVVHDSEGRFIMDGYAPEGMDAKQADQMLWDLYREMDFYAFCA